MTSYKSVTAVTTASTFISPSVFRQISDFANVFKSFIGTNWIGLPFAFRQSGLLLGCIGLALIAMATDHCSHLIITCKNAAVKKILSSKPKYNDPNTTPEELQEMIDLTDKKILYGDIGRIALGKVGTVLVEVSLLATQFGFCIGYLIFIGNTLGSLFPDVHVPIKSANSTNHSSTDTLYKTVSTAPIFPILVLIPILPLILMAFIRRIRKLGPVSFISNISLLVAFMSVLGYMLNGLHFRMKEIKLANWATFPVFFGQVSSAYEGMGTLVPIETSMGNNRHRYSLYLHFAVGMVSVLLGGFGIVGYFVYGDTTEQIVTQMLPFGPLVFVVRILLCLAILFTYPLQLYPITEVIESYIFKDANAKKQVDETAGDGEIDDQVNIVSKDAELLDSASVQDSVVTVDGCINDVDETTELVSTAGMLKPRKKKPNWRKNFLRAFIVLITAGIAIVLKDDFAYVGALCGSVGSSTLGFILPCIFHNVLCKETNSKLTVMKNYLLIAFGVVGGTVGLAVTVIQMVHQFSK